MNSVFTSHISAVPLHSKGWCLEIYGTEGVIVATSPMLPQMTSIDLKGSKGESEFQAMPIPDNLVKFNYLPEGPSANVGRNYGSMVEAILAGEDFHPNFDDALTIHRLLEKIKQSSDEKRTISTL